MVLISDKLCAVVIWYNPTKEDIYNIYTYLQEVNRLYIIDNSTFSNYSFLQDNLESIEYISNQRNIGIAAALNLGCSKAFAAGYRWILTMDQDSSFPNGMLCKYLHNAEKAYLNDSNIGLIACCENEFGTSKYAISVITSGNLVDLNIHQSIGGFTESLFIDQVDHDYCFKLRGKYKIFLVGDAFINHTIGDPIEKKIFGRKFSSYNHSAFRKYYMFRNNIYIFKKYKFMRFNVVVKLWRYFIAILLVESDKFNKLKRSSLGLFHGIFNIYNGGN